jgi:hypothetical protein
MFYLCLAFSVLWLVNFIYLLKLEQLGNYNGVTFNAQSIAEFDW